MDQVTTIPPVVVVPMNVLDIVFQAPEVLQYAGYFVCCVACFGIDQGVSLSWIISVTNNF